MKKILFICGSLRAVSASRATVKALTQALDGKCVMDTADIESLPHYNADIENDPNVERLKKQIEEADGVVFVTPEYNYSIPGVLKNAIDWASRPAFKSVFRDKSCFIVTISGGVMGGVRAQSHLKYILNGMLAVSFPWQEVLVPKANDKVEDGVMTDEAIVKFATGGLEAFLKQL